MLQVSNGSPFSCALSLLPDRDGIDCVFATVKGTFSVAGGRVDVADDQLPVFAVPKFYDDPKTSSMRYPSDVGLPKPATDVLLVGHAYGPGGRPTREAYVSVVVGPVRQDARVVGDRYWTGNGATYSLTEPEPFSMMPLVWERAFGGIDHVGEAEMVELRNPVGTGYRHSKGTDAVEGLRAPNIEDRANLLSSAYQSPPPAGFNAIGEHWLPRRLYGGTYDDEWQAARAPYLPDDFDERFLQVAPPGLTAPGQLQGGEPVELIGLSVDGVVRFALPRVALETTFVVDGSPTKRPVTLDTVILEPDSSRVTLVWRSGLLCDKRALRVNAVRVDVQAIA